MHGKQLRAVQSRSIDVVASVGIVLLACIVASPALDGGLLAVGDNAQHLVEIRELALPNSTGWSDQGFNGFPLNLLQSPLIYGGLAQLARAGLAIEPWYLLLNLASLCAPSLAAFWLVRAYLPLIPALLLGTSLLFYRSTPASLYGMFTFGLAAAAWLVVFTLLLRETRSLRSFAVLALLSACIGLSHVYVTIALVYLGIVHVACNALSGPDGRRKLIWDLPALALGAFSAAAYWMPNILARTPARGQAGRYGRIVLQLVTENHPRPPPGVSGALGRIAHDPMFWLDVPIQLSVLALAAASLLFLRKLPFSRPALYGAGLAGLLLLMMLIQPWVPVMLLGPQNERLVYFVKAAAVVAAIPATAWLSERWLSAKLALPLVAAYLLITAVLMRRVVAPDAIAMESSELADFRAAWSWIRQNKDDSWARIYVQDTFDVPVGGPVRDSHISALTADRTGLLQTGAYYGHTPYHHDELWVDFTLATTRPDRVYSAMRKSNSTHLLLVEPEIYAEFERDLRYQVVARFGRCLLLKLVSATPEFALVLRGQGTAAVQNVAPGLKRVKLGEGAQAVRIDDSYHAFWRAIPGARVKVSPHPEGLILLENPGGRAQEVELRYAPPRLPKIVTCIGLSLIFAVFLADWALRRVRRRELPNAEMVP